MTDQLEHDLRTLLADRAAEVMVDPVAGEQLIAQRLDAGECAPATVVPLGRRSDRGRWRPAAAAAACVAVLAAALMLSDRDDAGVSNQPPTTLLPVGSEGSRLALVGVDEVVDCSVLDHAAEAVFLVLPSGECVRVGDLVRGDLVIESATAVPNVADPDPHDLWNVEVAFSDSGSSLTRGLAGKVRAARYQGCGDGRIVVMIDDIVAEVLRPTDAFFFEGDRLRLPADVPEVMALTLARDLTASIGNPPPDVTVEEPVDHLLGEPGGAAKDVAERVMAELLGDPSITTSATDAGDGVHEVTLETSTGAEVVATVVLDEEQGAFRVTNIASPGVVAELTDDERLFADLPVGGTLRVRGFSEDFTSEVDATPGAGVTIEPGRSGPLPLPPADHVWLVLRLETGDGHVLWALSWR